MIANYFRTWFRNVLKYKTYAAINLLGLGIGIACCYLCVLYLLYDWRFDRFHQDHHRIYCVAGKLKHSKGIIGGNIAGTWTETAQFPVALSSMVSAEFPEIDLTTRVRCVIGPATWQVGTHKEFLRPIQEILFVDRSFEEMFSFPLIHGTFFARPGQVVITRRFAQTLTNDIDSLVGKVLWMRVASRRYSRDLKPVLAPVEIGGIVETPPRNSSLNFEILLPLSMSATFLNKKEGGWDWQFSSTHYIRLADEANMEEVEGKLTAFMQKQSSYNSLWDLETFQAKLQPITELHHYIGPFIDGVFRYTNPLYGYILGGISILVLFIACLNYVLLYVGRFNSRTKELGIRQIFGANRRQLRYQLLVECFGYSLLACIIGLSVRRVSFKSS